MSYENPKSTRANRAAKEQAKAKGNGKRGRKAKNATSEETEANEGSEGSGRKRKNALKPDVSEPRAKVARVCDGLELASAG